MLHITFTRQQAKCCGGEVLVTSPDASYGLATLTRQAPSTHPKSSRNEALFPFTIMIISPFFFISKDVLIPLMMSQFFYKKSTGSRFWTHGRWCFSALRKRTRIEAMACIVFFPQRSQSFGRSFSCTFCKYRDAKEQINRYKKQKYLFVSTYIYVYAHLFIYIYICTYVYVLINMKQKFINVDFSHINMCINSW